MPNFPIIGIVIINAIIVVSVFILEEYLQRNLFSKYSISYDNLDLLKPGSKNKLIKDISAKTGHDVLEVKIRNINFKKKIAALEIYFKE